VHTHTLSGFSFMSGKWTSRTTQNSVMGSGSADVGAKHTKTLSDMSGISTPVSVASVLVSVLSVGGQPATAIPMGPQKKRGSRNETYRPPRHEDASGYSRDADRRHPMSMGAPPLY
jgi:hypothetical protein